MSGARRSTDKLPIRTGVLFCNLASQTHEARLEILLEDDCGGSLKTESLYYYISWNADLIPEGGE
jgi:hypothetical protein